MYISPWLWFRKTKSRHIKPPEVAQQGGTFIPTTVLEGIIIGASAGLITGIILASLSGTKIVIQRWAERRSQIRHLATELERFRSLVYEARDLDLTGHPVGQVYSKETVRKAYLDDLHQQVKGILTGRADRLSFDEKKEIRDAFSIFDLHPQWIPNDSGCDKIFDDLEAIRWLHLSPRQREA